MKKVEIENCTLYLGRCEDILKNIDNKTIDCILTDPPYFKIVKYDWDNNWKNIKDFQAFTEKIGKLFYDKLKDNGSFYWFGDDKNIAYCQVVLDKYFNLLNHVVWHKTNPMKKGIFINRSYVPATERILFYDKGEIKNGLTKIHSVPDCFKTIKNYMRLEKEKIKKHFNFTNEKQFNDFINEVTNTKSVVSRHYFSDSQYIFPTKEIYKKLQSIGFFKKEYTKLKTEYQFFKREYEDLRLEYESLRRVWNSDINAIDVLSFARVKSVFHPTQKPTELIKYLIERSTRENNIVLDSFMGSGTTGVACIKTNRKFIGIERDEEYFNIAVKRIKEAVKEKYKKAV